jgi:hypothetical protein
MSRSQVLITAMTDADLRRIVLEPARRVGLTVEDGLADTIADDAAAQTGALPLVSTALLETWAARSGTTLTLAGSRPAFAQPNDIAGAQHHSALDSRAVHERAIPAFQVSEHETRRLFVASRDARVISADERLHRRVEAHSRRRSAPQNELAVDAEWNDINLRRT